MDEKEKIFESEIELMSPDEMNKHIGRIVSGEFDDSQGDRSDMMYTIRENYLEAMRQRNLAIEKANEAIKEADGLREANNRLWLEQPTGVASDDVISSYEKETIENQNYMPPNEEDIIKLITEDE